jgi:hypothetical protein
MRTPRLALALFALTLAACKAREAAPPPPEPAAPVAPVEATPPPTPAPAPEAEPAPTLSEIATPAPRPAAPTIAPAKPKPTTAPAAAPPKAAPTAPPAAPPAAAPPPPTAAPTAPPKPPAAPPASSSSIVDPGGEVVVAATKPGLTRIGADKCRVCHKVQHASWAASGHAKRNPPLDCEGCHGPGSEYKTLSVMKDPKKARAAGLVDPDAAYCGKCHKGPWDPALLRKAHAHKGS